MLGLNPRPQQPSSDELTMLRARIDQTLALVEDAARQHAANRALVDLALDVRNTLRPPARPAT